MIGTNSYNNPFENRDANSDSINDIINYWCEPEHITLGGMLSSDKTIVIEGPRGCGKTTLFKYYSYRGQKELGESFQDTVEQGRYFCIYHRLAEYNYSAMDGKGLQGSFWSNLFLHTFELKLALMLLEMIIYFVKEDESLENIEQDIVTELAYIKGLEGINLIDDLLHRMENYIREVNDFIRKRSMMEVEFSPDYWFGYYEIILPIIKIINKKLGPKHRFKVAFIIDEMENLSDSHQMVINTYIKFVKENISFRIGSRPAGITTYKTHTNEDIRENHDFNFIQINPYIKTEKYEKFLINIANKRLANSQYSKENQIKIESLLGRKEDVEFEIINKVPNDFNKHFELLKEEISKEKLDDIRDNDKLKELLNIIKINRGESVEEVSFQMRAFNNKDTKSEEYRKYQNAYINKYKKSLAFLILQLANKGKSYYSLKTYAYLSSGSTRVFLQLCHKVFELASFYSPEVLFENKLISIELQSQAALMVAESELNYLKRVGPYGREIYNLVDNICRLFRYYHSDVGLKYPETNQFTLDDELDEEGKKIINIARMHAFIIRKSNLQQRSIGQPKTYIYTINRIYFPLYDISCVTRGGYNPKLSQKAMKVLTESQIKNSKSIHNLIKGKSETEATFEQIIFEGLQ